MKQADGDIVAQEKGDNLAPPIGAMEEGSTVLPDYLLWKEKTCRCICDIPSMFNFSY